MTVKIVVGTKMQVSAARFEFKGTGTILLATAVKKFKGLKPLGMMTIQPARSGLFRQKSDYTYGVGSVESFIASTDEE